MNQLMSEWMTIYTVGVEVPSKYPRKAFSLATNEWQ
jgi:hypothetical protein